MCIVTYSDCPGCYGFHNNQQIWIERCLRQIEAKWELPDPNGVKRKKDDGPCSRALHVQYSLWKNEQYTTHQHIPGLVGQLLPKPHATLEFTGKLSDLELIPTQQEIESPEEEEEITEEEWTRILTKLAGYDEEMDPAAFGYTGPPIGNFTEASHETRPEVLKSWGLVDQNANPNPACPWLVDRWATHYWWYPTTVAPPASPSRPVVAEPAVSTQVEVSLETASEAEPTPLPSPDPQQPKPATKRKYKKREPKQPSAQEPSPPYSPGSRAKKLKAQKTSVGGAAQKTAQRPTTREKKEAYRRGREFGVKNARSGGKA